MFCKSVIFLYEASLVVLLGLSHVLLDGASQDVIQQGTDVTAVHTGFIFICGKEYHAQ